VSNPGGNRPESDETSTPTNPITDILAPNPPTERKFFRKALGKTRKCIACDKEYEPARRNQLTCGSPPCARAAWKRRNRSKVNKLARERNRRRAVDRALERRAAEVERVVEEADAGEVPTGRRAAAITPIVNGKGDIRDYIKARYGEDGKDVIARIHDIAFGLIDDIPIKVQLDACRELLDRGWGKPQQSLTVTPTVPVFALPESTSAGMFPDLGNPAIEGEVLKRELLPTGDNLPTLGNNEPSLGFDINEENL
jgi:hypothetical protein